MWPRDASEMEEIDNLAVGLAEAGQLARLATAHREGPDPVFAMRLRAELLRLLPLSGAAFASMDPTLAVEHRFTPLEAILPAQIGSEADDARKVAALKTSPRWHFRTRPVFSRHIAVGLAASVVVATVMYGSGVLWTGRPTASALADDAVAATLVRGGASSDLVAGVQLHPGDEIKVAAAGRATLHLGDNYVRLAGGADMRIDLLDPSQIMVDQVAGRAYHRAEAGATYQVATGAVTWQGAATVFDLDRHFTAGGGEQVRGLALYHGLGLQGPQIHESVPEGMSATVHLSRDGARGGTPVVEPIAAQALADSWLMANAGLDAGLGLPLGQFASLASPEPTTQPTPSLAVPPTEPSPAVPPTEPPTAVPPTAAPTVAPTAKQTAKPKPKPTVPADLGRLKIVQGIDNSYAISWPKYTGKGFQYYKLLYGKRGTTPTSPSSPYWACNDSPSANSWSGVIDAGDYAVRLQVVDESSGKTVIRAQTNVIDLTVTTSVSPLPPNPDGRDVTVNSTDGPSNSYQVVRHQPPEWATNATNSPSTSSKTRESIGSSAARARSAT